MTDTRLAKILGDRMPPSAVILHRDVLDGGRAAFAKIVRQLRVKPADGVETIEDVDPSTAHRLAGEPSITAPLRLQLVLDLVQSKGAAKRDQAIDSGTPGDPLQAVIGDHCAHAVRNDDVRPRYRRR